jgi:hypothetical protein
MIIEHGKRLVAQLVCIGNSNAILPMTTVAGVPPFHSGGTRGLTLAAQPRAGSRSSQITPTCLLADARRFRVTVAFLSVDDVMLNSFVCDQSGPPNVLHEQTRMHYVRPRVES